MDIVDVTEKAKMHQNMDLLTASELVSLRKPDEESERCVIGEKFYAHSDTWLENKAVECALESHKDGLNKKRAARICDLIQAEWNEELSVSITSKLKGKFIQHMGHAFDGKIALTPEESLFLLENGYIEIKNGQIPLSTQEAYKVMLKDNLSAERYQVYSHLSQLGFIVVTHQTELGVTSYEKRMHLDKQPTKKKRKVISDLSEEPGKKRLTFTGVFTNEPQAEPDTTEGQIDSSEVVEQICPSESAFAPSSIQQSDESKEPEANASSNHAIISEQNEENKEYLSSPGNTARSKTDATENSIPSINVLPSVSCEEIVLQTENSLKEANALNNLDNNSMESNEQIDVVSSNQMNAQDTDDSQTCTEVNSNLLTQMNDQRPSNTSHSKNDVDVMDVDSQNTEVSCDDSETSRNNFNIHNVSNSNINQISQDSSCALINNTDSAPDLVPEENSNFDVMSCSSETEEEDAISLTADTDTSLSQHSHEDSEVELLEVTKKETKPLDVIDIASEEDSNDSKISVGDDEIQVVKVFSGLSPKVSSTPRIINSRKFNECKKEERSSPVTNPKFSAPTLTVQFPELYRRDLVCVAGPPLDLMPYHVKPAKEAYVIDFKKRGEQPQEPPARLWNSYKDMQDYQWAKRQNRNLGQSFNAFRNRGRWQGNNPHRDFRQSFDPRQSDSPEALPDYQSHEPSPWPLPQSNLNYNNVSRDHVPNFNRNQTDSPEVLANSHKNFGHSSDSNAYPFDSSRNHEEQSRFPVPNTAVNSILSVSNQNMNVSMVGNRNFNPLNSNTEPISNFSPSMPSLSGLAPADILAEVQRTAYSVATNMLSSMFGQNFSPQSLPMPNPRLMTPFTSFPSLPNYASFGYSPRYNSPFNTQNYNSEQYSNQSYRRNPYRRQHRGAPFPCHYRGVGNRRSWNEVKEAVGDGDKDSPVGSDIEEIPLNPMEILWDSKGICPLVKAGTKYLVSDVLKTLQLTRMANLVGKSKNNDKCFPSTCSLVISFDVYLPGTNYKKTRPDIPKHRIIVVRSTDPVPRYSEIAFLQRKWNDGATLQVAVVDNGDISFQSFNSICLPVLIPHED